MKRYMIDIRRCRNGTDIICQPDSVIDKWIPHVLVYLTTGVKYFDFDDYDRPVKKLTDDSRYFKLMPNIKKEIKLYLRKEEVALTDSIFPFAGERKEVFYSFKDFTTDFDSIEDTTTLPFPPFPTVGKSSLLLRYMVIQDPIISSYERRVYSFLDFSGQLGGFFEILAITGGLLVTSFANKMYYYSLFNKLYSINYQKPENDGSTYKVNVKPRNKFPIDLKQIRTLRDKASNIKASERADG